MTNELQQLKEAIGTKNQEKVATKAWKAYRKQECELFRPNRMWAMALAGLFALTLWAAVDLMYGGRGLLIGPEIDPYGGFTGSYCPYP